MWLAEPSSQESKQSLPEQDTAVEASPGIEQHVAVRACLS